MMCLRTKAALSPQATRSSMLSSRKTSQSVRIYSIFTPFAGTLSPRCDFAVFPGAFSSFCDWNCGCADCPDGIYIVCHEKDLDGRHIR